MPSPAFRRESRTVERFVGLPGVEKAKLWPTVARILDEARAVHQTISDQIVLGALNDVLTRYIQAGRYEECFTALGKVLGHDFLPAKPLPEREAKPLAKVAR